MTIPEICGRQNEQRIKRINRNSLLKEEIRLIRLIRCFLQAAGIRLISCEINAPNESVKIRAICGSLLSASGFRGRFFLLGWCTYCSGKRQSRAETSAPPENSIRLIRLIRY